MRPTKQKKYLKFTSSVLRHRRRQPRKQITVEGRVRKQLSRVKTVRSWVKDSIRKKQAEIAFVYTYKRQKPLTD